jgi:ribosomal protein L37AE/L43A
VADAAATCTRIVGQDATGPLECGAEPGRGGWCGNCALAVHHALADLPEVYVELHLALTPGGTVGEPVSGTATAPIPIRTDVRALAETIVGATTAWERELRIHLGHSAWWRRGREAPALLGAVRYLASYLPEAIAYSNHGAHLVLRLRHHARLLLGQTRLIHRLWAACPRCAVAALERLDGSDWVNCAACGAGWDGRGYHHLVRDQAAALTVQAAS